MTDAPANPTARSVEMKSRAKRQFDAWAGSYDRSVLNHFMFRPSCTMAMEEIARWYKQHRRAFRVLDIGCGTGTLASALAVSPWPVTTVGLDYSPAMCSEAADKTDRAGFAHTTTFVAGDSEHLPFADDTFDIVTCSNSFHHYPHQLAVVREIRRILAPGGRFILIDGFRDNVIGWVVFDVLIHRIEGKVHHAPWPQIHRYFLDAGFTNIRRRKINLWFPLLVTVGDA